MTRRSIHITIGLTLLVLLTAGLWLTMSRTGELEHTAPTEVWTCSMHPEIREHAPGQCPKCGMDLVKAEPDGTVTPAATGEAEADTPRAAVQLDTRRRQLLGVRTARAELGPIERRIRAVGLVRYDETRLADVNLKLDGWITKLHVNSTGQAIRRGQPLLDVYSPDLLATEHEYLLALSTRDTMQQSRIPDAKLQAERLVESARQRLTLWDLPAEELDRLERTRKAEATVTLRSPATGFVIEKPVVEGMRAMAGQTLYKVADLSHVWVEADVFESDAQFVRPGTPAEVTVDAWPGETLRGKAVYVYPFVEEKTRTLRVRFALPNPGVRLKPGMYANVGMLASIGKSLTIPSDALIDSGREQLVFLAQGDGYFEPRHVQAGQRFGDRVQILSGLQAGDEVATGATFLLDSESQLRAAAGGWSFQADSAEEPAQSGDELKVDFQSQPDPPRTGENTFEVRVADAEGQPVTDAQVRLVLFMPAMPSMNMPAMSSQAALAHAQGGVYRGTALVSMAGRWDVTITVSRAGRRVASKQAAIVAK